MPSVPAPFHCCEETPWLLQLLWKRAFKWGHAHSFRGFVYNRHGGEHGATRGTGVVAECYILIHRPRGWKEFQKNGSPGLGVHFLSINTTPSDSLPSTRPQVPTLLILSESSTLWWLNIKICETMGTFIFKSPQLVSVWTSICYYVSLAGLEASGLYLKVSPGIQQCWLVTEVSLVTVAQLGQVQLLNTETKEQEGFNWSSSEVRVRVPERNGS